MQAGDFSQSLSDIEYLESKAALTEAYTGLEYRSIDRKLELR